jgi:anti-anti-sigma regulatory factor
MEISNHADKLSIVDNIESLSERLPKTVVLQPHGAFSGEAGVTFQSSLDQAIVEAAAVIVDLLWVNRVDDQGIAILLAGMKRAQASGKSLAFLAMNGATRVALDAVWEQQRKAEASPQTDRFTPNFEQFLDDYKSTKV